MMNSFPYIPLPEMQIWFRLNSWFAPNDYPAVYWQTLSVKEAMRIFRIQMHRHEYDHVFNAIYFFAAAPEELGLNIYPYQMKKPWIPMVLDTVDDLMLFKKHLLQKASLIQDKILCMQEGHNSDSHGRKRKMLPCCNIPMDLNVGPPL
eukprot:UN28948